MYTCFISNTEIKIFEYYRLFTLIFLARRNCHIWDTRVVSIGWDDLVCISILRYIALAITKTGHITLRLM